MMVIQHPYGESDQKTISEAANTGEGAYVGFLGPFKTADLAGVTSLDMEPIAMPVGDDRHKVSFLAGIPFGLVCDKVLHSLVILWFCDFCAGGGHERCHPF